MGQVSKHSHYQITKYGANLGEAPLTFEQLLTKIEDKDERFVIEVTRRSFEELSITYITPKLSSQPNEVVFYTIDGDFIAPILSLQLQRTDMKLIIRKETEHNPDGCASAKPLTRPLFNKLSYYLMGLTAEAIFPGDPDLSRHPANLGPR